MKTNFLQCIVLCRNHELLYLVEIVDIFFKCKDNSIYEHFINLYVTILWGFMNISFFCLIIQFLFLQQSSLLITYLKNKTIIWKVPEVISPIKLIDVMLSGGIKRRKTFVAAGASQASSASLYLSNMKASIPWLIYSFC